MRMKAISFFLAVTAILMVGCSADKSTNSNSDTQDKVTIKAYYSEPESLKNKETIVLNGVSQGEFVEIVVNGVIKNFELVQLTPDGPQAMLKEKAILKSLDTVENQTIVIKTYLPEGIPSEKLKWKSSKGNSYEYVLQEQGVDAKNKQEGTVIILE